MVEKRGRGVPQKVVQQPISVASAAESGDHLSALKALRAKLASEIDSCASKRDLAPLSRQLQLVLAQIEAHRPARTPKRDEIAAKRAQRQAAARAGDSADSSR